MLRPTLHQAAIFSTEVALAELLISWGVRPAALTGHSLGEYSAAVIGGVLSLEGAAALIATRGRIYEELPGGAATLIVSLSERALETRLKGRLSLAAVNGPDSCAVSGMQADIGHLEAELCREEV